MAASTIQPEKFDSGDIVTWFRQFECCATANNWNEEKRLRVLPAFLRGPAATYFHALPNEAKDSYQHLKESLQACFCPIVDRERNFSEFESRRLKPGEDPTIFLWNLKELLSKADPSLQENAREALLSRQFMRGLPEGMRLKLLEANPTPSLEEMEKFAKRFRAISQSDLTPLTFAAKATAGSDDGQLARNIGKLQETMTQLTAAVSALQGRQEHLEATVSSPAPPPSHQRGFANPSFSERPRDGFRQQSRKNKGRWNKEDRRCFNCNGLGHYVNSCPYTTHCDLCLGWGHGEHQCANNYIRPSPISTVNGKSLNFKGVPQ